MSVAAFDKQWTERVSGDIRFALDKIADDLRSQSVSDHEWSRKILCDVAKLGRGRKDAEGKGIWVYASRVEDGVADGGEWLFDLCWLAYEGKERGASLIGIPLAMELEWGNEGDIYDDFEKLLVSRALLRVMVFQEVPKKSTQELCSKLCNLVRRFEGTQLSDLYLLCGYDHATRKFDHRHITQNQITECVKH